MKRFKMLIDGVPRESASGKVGVIYNPANGKPVAEVAWGGREDADLALKAAQKAFPGWAGTDPGKRGDLLHRAADLGKDRKSVV